MYDWWERLNGTGPDYGYFPNAAKTWLVTKQSSHDDVKNLFSGIGVNDTSEGRPHLGAAIGSKEYVKTFAESKTKEWLSNVKCLA